MTRQEQMVGFGADEGGNAAELVSARKRQGWNTVVEGNAAMVAEQSRQDLHDGGF